VDKAFTERLRKAANDIRSLDYAAMKPVTGVPLALEVAADDIDELRELIIHCWIHSGHPNCGYDQMTTDQKLFYGAIIAEEDR
jgi:hypothetical protein